MFQERVRYHRLKFGTFPRLENEIADDDDDPYYRKGDYVRIGIHGGGGGVYKAHIHREYYELPEIGEPIEIKGESVRVVKVHTTVKMDNRGERKAGLEIDVVRT